jgi:exodeoxyribonuclease V beta subunit
MTSATPIVTPFDLADAPPRGLTVLEASAGTGKTYSLAGLTVLGLATGRVTTREVLVVTFTEAATAELSGRLRSRLAKAVELLERTDVTAGDRDDSVDQLLLDCDSDERSRRAARLAIALAEFDAMTISTIHGYCQRLLSAAGSAAVAVSADNSDIDDVVSDHILAAGDMFDRPDRLITAVRRRLALPDAALGAFPGAKAEHRTRLDIVIELVERAVATVLDRRRRWRHRTFDSMITDTRDLVFDEVRGPALVAELRDRFQLVLIDEFQDTDRVQWDIFRRCFLDDDLPGDRSAVVVVGDPKQSIYRFRGAELSAYLAAVDYARATGGHLRSLGTNYRSDADLLRALDRVFLGATFGDATVRFSPVAAGRDDARRLIDPTGDEAALIWRLMHPTADDKGKVRSPDGQRWAKADLVNEVVRHLSDVRIVRKDGTEEPVQPADIGIIVRSNDLGEELAEMLRTAGVPVTTSGSDSVLDSLAAQHWDTLIVALSRPSSLSDARAVALGAFGSLSAGEVADLDESGEAALLERHRELIAALGRGGVPRLMAELRRNGYPQRLLADLGGERLLTDIDHIAELLQRATGGRSCSPSRLASAMTDLRSLSNDSVSGELVDRRLDRDDATVKIMTVHKAKGLEFPVVFCPVLWNEPGGSTGLRHAHLDPPGHRLFNTMWLIDQREYKATSEVKDAAVLEEQAENRRNLYVAMTRAVHRLVMWEVPGFATTSAPLRSLLDTSGCLDLDAVADESNGAMSVVHVDEQPVPDALQPVAVPLDDLDVASFDRNLESAWRVWSFTGIERAVADGQDHAPVPAPAGGFDEPGAAPDIVGGDTLRTVPGSAAFGSLVHGVLEIVDFASGDLAGDLERACSEALQYRSMGVSAETLAAGLTDALTAPLGGPLGGIRLVDLRRSDRLDELEFLLPLASMSALDIARIISDGLPDDDPMRPWFEMAAAGGLDVDIDGMLTGSIDLVARFDGRYLVADYKTNRIASDAEFTVDEMVEEMHRHGYPLQAVLYMVALRRYLRLRLGSAFHDDLMLGSAYLFVRGMDPTRTADDGRGVMWWCPPASVIEALDSCFENGVTR